MALCRLGVLGTLRSLVGGIKAVDASLHFVSKLKFIVEAVMGASLLLP